MGYATRRKEGQQTTSDGDTYQTESRDKAVSNQGSIHVHAEALLVCPLSTQLLTAYPVACPPAPDNIRGQIWSSADSCSPLLLDCPTFLCQLAPLLLSSSVPLFHGQARFAPRFSSYLILGCFGLDRVKKGTHAKRKRRYTEVIKQETKPTLHLHKRR